MNRQIVIEKMFGYLTDEHKQNIHEEAFRDIANVFLDLYDEYDHQWGQYVEFKTGEREEKPDRPVSWVCNASMGHGKTTVLICFLKWLASETNRKKRIPVLLVIREVGMIKDIYDELKAFNDECIVMVDSTNRQEIEPYIHCHQFVIITHARLDNLALGLGNLHTYRLWKQYNTWAWGEILDEDNIISKRNRLMIFDEKPSFVNASVFDIGSKHNTLDWFDDLATPLKLDALESQCMKSYIATLVAYQLSQNATSVTTALAQKDDLSLFTQTLKKIIIKIKNHEDNKGKLESLRQLKHFQKLLNKDGAGRIDDYEIRGQSGRKIIISERIDYIKLKMNMLVLDGTAIFTSQQYKGFKLKEVNNYNDYSRFYYHIETINTSKYARSKKGQTTQRAISERIMKLKQSHPDMFVLPMKSDIEIYKQLGAILEDIQYFVEKSNEDSKPINLLNTTGKNELKDRKALYLTSLPKMNADHYKKIAISLYGTKVDLGMNDEDDANWFKDNKLELIYCGELQAELLQIMHRTALRKIKSKDEIHVFVAYDDEDMSKLKYQKSIPAFSHSMNQIYCANKAVLQADYVVDESQYGRGDKLRNYADLIHHWIHKNITVFNPLPMRISEIDKPNKLGEKFRDWLNKHWNEQEELINKIFSEFGYVIYEKKDRYSEKSKYITTIQKNHDRLMFGE
ncbi:hypothetical protein SAMN04487970_106122 [Paenibacillus tianmuensis]|uniref:Type III restriction enzyme, res subunit n=1 Tax=Paenibacillus tianmuensis TaxID=624147 RepID=A0A1G4TQ89_9BACL|nr:hypothetical protein [Paenibacillus tianmuensis]SCW83417.1 hypothetical protein SAMN04487970_106122 [Paenibacillus tianmuensis]